MFAAAAAAIVGDMIVFARELYACGCGATVADAAVAAILLHMLCSECVRGIFCVPFYKLVCVRMRCVFDVRMCVFVHFVR